MVELTLEQGATAAHLACENSSLYFTSVLAHRAEGSVWADCPDNPSFLLVWSRYQEGFQLMGKALPESEWEDFRSWFSETIPDFLKKHDVDCFEYGVDNTELADMMQSIWKDRKIFSSSQLFYHFKGNIQRRTEPAEYRIYKVDESFMQRQEFDMSFLSMELQEAFGDMGMQKGAICYVAVKDKTVVARANMFFWDDRYGNISVSTKEEHQNKGLASCLASAVIADTCALGLIPVWDCTDDNLASQMTAQKCGFEKMSPFPIYCIDNM